MIMRRFIQAACLLAWPSMTALSLASPQPPLNVAPVISICTQRGGAALGRQKDQGRLFEIPAAMAPANAQAARQLCARSFAAGQGRSILIKRRGHSSYQYPKHQYQIDFVDAQGNDQAVELLGMPEGEEWVLHGPYTDRSYMRNALAYSLGRQIGANRNDQAFAPRTRYTEVFVDGDYRGLYLATEKIARGSERVAIDKFRVDGQGPSPYIFELAFDQPDLTTGHGTRLQYVYPSRRKIERLLAENRPQGEAWRKRLLDEAQAFENRLLHATTRGPGSAGELGQVIDIDSFADYFIMQEVFKNLDGFRASAYFHQNNDGRVQFGPLWDFDNSAGNITFIWKTHKVSGWSHGKMPLYHRPVFWFGRLLANREFSHRLVGRYHYLRQPGMPLSHANIDGRIAALRHEMGEAAWRDQARWEGTHDAIDQIFRNTKEHGESVEEHVAIMRKWLHMRLRWLDAHMPRLAR